MSYSVEGYVLVYLSVTHLLIIVSQIDMLSNMVMERDEVMFEMQWTINDQDDELRRLC